MDSFEKLLQYAVTKEDEAAAFYEFLAAEAGQENIRQVFLELAEQEKEHRKVFENVVSKGCSLGHKPDPHLSGLHIVDYLVETPFDPHMSYQDTIILAMKREEKSEALYRDLAHKVADACLAETIVNLAEQEAAHKTKLEKIYERDVLTED